MGGIVTELMFKALGDATRLRIMALLIDRQLCVCEIMDCLDLTQSNASRHLTILKNAGLLSGRKQAQWAYYQISDTCPVELHQYLTRTLPELPVSVRDQERLRGCRAADSGPCNSQEKEKP